jgi:FkbH-like protein
MMDLPTPALALRDRLRAALAIADADARFAALALLADTPLSFIEEIQLDKAIAGVPADVRTRRLPTARVALLSTSTTEHMLPSVRVGGLRHGLLVDAFAGSYGQYRRELLDPSSPLHAFRPEVIVLSLSARPLFAALPITADEGEVARTLEAQVAELQALWSAARDAFGAVVVQQTFLDVFEPVFGSFDRLVAAAPARVVARLNDRVADAAARAGVLLLDVARASARDGLDAWYDNARWLQGKMEIAPHAAPAFGRLLARVVAAQRGRSRKCLVLDLDNTLWGGVVGDVGLEGLVLGEGSAGGEAFLELQRYARQLKERGVILAVCSKNDPAIAADAFARHPEMVLKPGDIAAFVADWNDKAANLRLIAEQLNIGLDSLVFVDDNPAERARVRDALPMVAVPDLPPDPGQYVRCVAAGGYFEAVSFTADDAQRAGQYAANAQREALRAQAQSMDDFLRGLQMTVAHGPVAPVDLARATQLINKTNQFNTTGRRYAAEEVAQAASDPARAVLQFRLVDRLGDNGLVSVMILQPATAAANAMEIDTWVMSCRVFGRQLEDEVLNIAVEVARARGAQVLFARYVPTERNGVIANLFPGLGFEAVPADAGEATQRWKLDLARYAARPTFIERKAEST